MVSEGNSQQIIEIAHHLCSQTIGKETVISQWI